MLKEEKLKLKLLLEKLKLNIIQNIDYYPNELLIDLLENYVFYYFEEALKFYKSCLETLKFIKPEIILIPSDCFETHCILAITAKELSIKTALIPHGLTGSTFTNYKVGRFKIFDYFFGIGEVDYQNYKNYGIEKKFIKIIGLPYFQKYIPNYNKKIFFKH